MFVRISVFFRIMVAGLVFGAFLSLFCLFTSTAKGDEAAFAKLKEATVHIAIGSGSIVVGASGNEYLLTNWHVCNAGSWKGKMRANYEDGTLIEAPLVKLDALSDLCASKVTPTHAALKVASSLRMGQHIYTRGYPYGVLSFTEGSFIGANKWDYFYAIEEVGECPTGSRKERAPDGRLAGCVITYFDNVTNMYSRPGSSGSPVVDAKGELIGVMSSWDGNRDAGGMVTLEAVKRFMQGL